MVEYTGSEVTPKTAMGDSSHVLQRYFNGDREKYNKWLETLSDDELDKLYKNPMTYKIKEGTLDFDTYETFDKAFAAARKAEMKTFEYKGKKYNTKLKK